MASGVRQGVVILVAGAVIGFALNAVRPDPLPLSGPIQEEAPAEPGADLPGLPPEEALARWMSGTLFLDVRPEVEYEAGRIAGSFPLRATDYPQQYFETVAAFGTEVPLFVYGAGADSHEVRRVAAFLIDLGHVDVSLAVCGVEPLLAGGIDRVEGPGEGL